ncbi:histidine kinase dimerization/phospho-acceptor domain-containing protein [Paenibacillus sp. OAS669]|uniref:histidine kinase dimerization/phospho-acceptor domain-containing protein n=1 Tax=Paenibacillus sp. OAS669 TaxID=2663821 RepID=UPI0039A3A215
MKLSKERSNRSSTSGLTHEIKNPPTIVMGYLDILAGNNELNTKVKDMIDQIQVAGSHMNSVITHYEQVHQER